MMKNQTFLGKLPGIVDLRLFNSCIVQDSVPEQQHTFYQANQFQEIYKDKFKILVSSICPSITQDWNK